METPQVKKGNLIFTGGQMASEVSAKDWSQTPLGPIEDWPQSLRTTINLCLASSFPISIAWGPERIQIYNDGYWQICGDKHPTSMGQDFRECWRTAWPVIGDAFESAEKGQTKFLENQRIFIDRNGYLEETFFTFSFSPIIGESGRVEGLFHPVTELTQQSLGDRRMNVLRSIAMHTANAKNTSEALTQIIEVVKEHDLDIPFSLLYTVHADGNVLRLAGKTGLSEDSPLCPTEVDLRNQGRESWPFSKAMTSKIRVKVEDLQKKFGDYSCGPYDESPKTALMLPLHFTGSSFPFAVFIAGVSSRRALDDPYYTFFDLASSAFTSSLTKAKAFEDEQKKAEALMEIDKAKTTFFSNISHEFRTPLTLMLGPIEDTLNDLTHPLQVEQKERLLLVQRNALRLQRLVNSLLDFSRIEAGRINAKFQPTDLRALTKELASVFRSAMEKGNIEFEVDCEVPAELIYIDREMWEKIVFNLLSNALKFTFKGKISIRLTEEEKSVTLSVSDTGEGIPPADLPNLFKRFYRVQGTKSRTHEGSGIGLAFTHELIGMHGGTIHVQSTLGQGTTFTVRIPKGNQHLPQEKLVTTETDNEQLSTADFFVNESNQWFTKANERHGSEATRENLDGVNNHKRILVVDDNSDMLGYVTRILSSNKEWKIINANNGVEAMAIIKQGKPDLVLSDIMMPEMDGFELLKKIREDLSTNLLPVILLSARAGEEATLEGLERKANDYLVKPFSARELFTRIKTQLELETIRQNNMELVNDLALKTRELEQFIYITTHDLQEPLRTVSNYIKLFEEDCNDQFDDTARKYLRSIDNATNRMIGMVKGLLNFSRLGKQRELSYVDGRKLINDVIADLQSAITSSGAIIHIDEIPELYVYEMEMRQLFQNLISNAIKFRRKDVVPEIRISVKKLNEKWRFSISDNGIGIEPAYRERIFDIFQQLHNREEYDGNGIGLANCKKIVELHKGKIWVEANSVNGSIFNFVI